VVCKDAQELIHGYMDGELDPFGNLEIERHLEGCEACSEVYKREHTLHSLMQNPSLKFKPPARLQSTIESAVRKADKAERGRRWTVWPAPWRWLSVAASLASLAVLIWVAAVVSRPAGQDLIAQEVVSSHVRSLMAGHLTDVPTSDQHTVKPWFTGKLDFSPPVKDLTAQGFILAGGRLDYLGQTPAAALIYRRRQHVINLFIWPAASDRATGIKIQSRRGYNLIHWTQSGITYWAVSDLNTGELQEFVRLVFQ
jgi:anti-sigma factor RsiW